MTIQHLIHDIPGVHTCLPGELAPNDAIALPFNEGHLPWQVLRVEEITETRTWLHLARPGYRPISRALPTDEQVTVLPRHHGVCRCGYLAPCPDEQVERILVETDLENRTSSPAPDPATDPAPNTTNGSAA